MASVEKAKPDFNLGSYTMSAKVVNKQQYQQAPQQQQPNNYAQARNNQPPYQGNQS